MEQVRGTAAELQRITIHGHERAFVKMGQGPALLLLHGLGCDHTTWIPVIRDLARHYTVIAPDLLGHGVSAKPRADYSVGGYANGMRDLLTMLNIDKVTVVGHSFGGGIAMQFAYQFPERTERMILVAPGGLGPEVSPFIRAVTLPGFHQVMGVATLPGLRHAGQGRPAGALAVRRHRRARPRTRSPRSSSPSRTRNARAAIRHVVRAVVDMKGQIVTMVDRAYLTQAMPMLVVWGTDDVGHPRQARRERRPDRPRRGGRGAAEQRPLPPQGPPRPLREDRRRPSSGRPSRRRTTAGAGASCSATAPPSPSTAPRPASTRSPRSRGCRGGGGRRRADGFTGQPVKPALVGVATAHEYMNHRLTGETVDVRPAARSASPRPTTSGPWRAR